MSRRKKKKKKKKKKVTAEGLLHPLTLFKGRHLKIYVS
jgi:hypothetical protein